MTEQEMRERMIEIDKERSRLKKEREGYEEYFRIKKENETQKFHREYIGKCLQAQGDVLGIIALKVIGIEEKPNEDYAKCVVIRENDPRKNCWENTVISIERVGLWTMAMNNRIVHGFPTLLIDDFYEISQEKFNEIYDKYISSINEYVYSDL